MKNINIIILLVVLSISAYAQEVVSTAGGHFESTDVVISWTLGEPVIETFSNINFTLTQGFHQTKLMITPVFTISENRSISVYPNPTDELIHIQCNNIQLLNSIVGIYAIDGKLLKTHYLNSENSVLSVKEYPNEIYLLKIIKGNEVLQTFKIFKMK